MNDIDKGQDTGTDPVTTFVTARPAARKAAEWEQALGELIHASLAFPGQMGTTVLKPRTVAQLDYRIITRFDSTENMRRWQASDERRRRLARLSTLQAAPADIQQVSGLETWFELPHADESPTMSPPPKFKMAVVVWIAVYFAVIPLIHALRPLVSGLPTLVGAAISAAASVVLMTWVVRPLLSWAFRSWLCPTKNPADICAHVSSSENNSPLHIPQSRHTYRAKERIHVATIR